ncbi:hypothetical protein [Streptomyces sp. NPDC059918]|uniref:hypothetical protein n=1 Tax=unclassified Streptomyces TaxID=2593676 RepID=UPI003653B575
MRLPKQPRVYDPKGGRPPKHGPELRFAKPATWPEPAITTVTETTNYGNAKATDSTPDDVDRFSQAFLRRFDLEHTFRSVKQTLDWTTPRLRTPEAADRCPWILCPTRVPKPRGAGPGSPPGTKNKHRAPRYDVGKTVKRPETLKATGKPGRSW